MIRSLGRSSGGSDARNVAAAAVLQRNASSSSCGELCVGWMSPPTAQGTCFACPRTRRLWCAVAVLPLVSLLCCAWPRARAVLPRAHGAPPASCQRRPLARAHCALPTKPSPPAPSQIHFNANFSLRPTPNKSSNHGQQPGELITLSFAAAVLCGRARVSCCCVTLCVLQASWLAALPARVLRDLLSCLRLRSERTRQAGCCAL